MTNKIQCDELEFGYDIDLANGRVSHCCKFKPIIMSGQEFELLKDEYFYKNSETLKARSDLENGIKTPSCQDCWNSEEQGIVSWRQLHNNTTTSTIKLNLQISTLCNQTCFYCTPMLSSSIFKHENWINNYGEVERIVSRKEFSIDYGQIINFVKKLQIYHPDKNRLILGITGGEPFILKDFDSNIADVIEAFCFSNKDNSVYVNISTNGNVHVDNLHRFYEMIIRLKEKYNFKVNITISVDNIEERAEYVRGGLVWSNLVNNLKVHRIHADNLDIRSTLNVFSIAGITDYIKFFSNYRVKFVYNYTHQQFYRMSVLDKSFIKYLVDMEDYVISHRLDEYFIRPWFKTLKNEILDDKKNAKIFKKAITNLDQIRNTNWRPIFPEYHQWFDSIE